MLIAMLPNKPRTTPKIQFGLSISFEDIYQVLFLIRKFHYFTPNHEALKIIWLIIFKNYYPTVAV
jgi:hypothetical protein